MPTLQELMDGTDSAGAFDKTASAVDDITVTDEIEKLALEIGLNPNEEVNTNSKSHTKEANMQGLEQVYNNLFPGDVIEKTASETEMTKEAAAVEEAMGKYAYDAFQTKVDEIVTKLAQEAIDAEPVQAFDNNRAGTGPINTTPVIDNELPAESGAAVVGHEQQKHAAFRKAMLLNSLNQ